MDQVNDFIANIKNEWQIQKCRELLSLQIGSNKDIEASIKWGNPYFSLNGQALLKWYIADNWINVYFFKGSSIKDEAGLFEKTDNSKMRTFKLFPDTIINERAYKHLLKQAEDLNS